MLIVDQIAVEVINIADVNGRYLYTFEQAQAACEGLGLQLATQHQLEEAWRQGFDSCHCGWLAERIVRYPSQISRSGCGGPGIKECPTNPGEAESGVGWNAYCATNSRKPNNNVEVINIADVNGRYLYTYEQAGAACRGLGLQLATQHQLEEAWRQGFDSCHCGWLAERTVRYPIQVSREGCEGPGIMSCPTNPSDWGQQGWDAYCAIKLRTTNKTSIEDPSAPIGKYESNTKDDGNDKVTAWPPWAILTAVCAIMCLIIACTIAIVVICSRRVLQTKEGHTPIIAYTSTGSFQAENNKDHSKEKNYQGLNKEELRYANAADVPNDELYQEIGEDGTPAYLEMRPGSHQYDYHNM